MKINNVELASLGRPFLVAEAASSHQGDADVALQMARAGAECGADALTFQEIDEQRLYTVHPGRAELYQNQVGWDCLKECRDIAKAAGLAFSVCVTDSDSLRKALVLGIDFIKIVSYDVTFTPFLAECGQTGLPILMSTGASLFNEIDAAVATLNAQDRLVLYHTDCGYPTDDAEVNLLRMVRLRERFGLPTGYCDHTNHGLSCLAATAMGAAVIEKHFTLDRAAGGPDHMVALEPAEITQLFRDIKRVAAMRGEGADRIPEGDIYRRTQLRRSVALLRPVKAGEIITGEMLTMLRPSGGLSWAERATLVGKTAARDLPYHHQITHNDVR